jgi:hypothetical protein
MSENNNDWSKSYNDHCCTAGRRSVFSIGAEWVANGRLSGSGGRRERQSRSTSGTDSVAPAPSYKARHYKRLYMSATRYKRGY